MYRTATPVAARFERVPTLSALLYGSAAIPLSLVGTSLALYLYFFYTDTLGLAPLYLSAVMVIGSAWDAVSEDGDAARVGYMPTFRFRKGLPWSFEVGMDVAWLAGTRQMAVGGYGRWAFLDGWRQVPDMALSLGYTGYVGNDQLDLGVFDLSVSIGYTFDVASDKTAVRPATRFSPFAGWQYLVANAAPSFVDVDEVDRVSGWVNTEDPLVGVDPLRFRYHRAFVGLQIGAGEVAVRMSGDFTFGKDAPVQVGFNLGVGVEF